MVEGSDRREFTMTERHEVVVVGGGSAGLAVSHELGGRGIEHVVLERGRVGQTWRDRWDSFCLVTPNWTVQLPGGAYSGADPDGFMPRDDIVAHLQAYAGSFSAPLREGVSVASLRAEPSGGFVLDTSVGEVRAQSVVVCTGAYQHPHRPADADNLPAGLLQLDTEGYRAPEALPPGKVLVVGSGQSGCQLAEELHLAGRDVFLACGKAPWAPRRIGGRDLLGWAAGTPFLEALVTDMPSPPDRLGANGQATGHGGGHDLHYRTLRGMGVTLLGHFRGAVDGNAYFASDLAESVAFGDARYAEVRNLIRQVCADRGLVAPEMPDPPAFRAEPPDSLNLAGFGAVIFTSGFRPDYSRWVRFEAFDELGFPLQRDGASTAVPGLYFCGVHMLRKRKSSLLLGVGEDAAVVASTIAKRRAITASA
jgi:putative flavoprotein involved in K+ transport